METRCPCGAPLDAPGPDHAPDCEARVRWEREDIERIRERLRGQRGLETQPLDGGKDDDAT